MHQCENDLTIYTHNLQNQSGTILTYDALGKGTSEDKVGDIILYGDAQKQPLETLDLSNGGIIQFSKNIYMTVNPKGSDEASGLSQTGKIIANQILDATINGSFANNNVIFASLGNIVAQTANDNRNPGVYLTVNGNYTINADEGLSTKGDLSIKANDITNNDALVAANDVIISANSLTNNATGFIYGMNNLKIDTSGNIDNNQGVLQTDQGSMNITAGGDVTNIGGLIRAQGEFSDITIQANSFTNKYSGNITTSTVSKTTVYSTAINAAGQEYEGMTNKAFTDTYANIYKADGINKVDGLDIYYYPSNVKILKIAAPEGLYTSEGKPASGYVYYFLSYGAGNPNTRVEVTASGTQSVLNGTSAIISAGQNLVIHTNGVITNDVSHLQAGRNMDLNGSSLVNTGYQDDVFFLLNALTETSVEL